MIRLERVDHVFGTGRSARTALRGIHADVHRHAFVALTGPSGSGKTTLLHIAGAIEAPTRGRVVVEGRDLGSLSDADRSDFRLRRLGFVFQDIRLVPVLSARENVELPLLFRRDIGRAERRARAQRMLDGVALQGRHDCRPAELSAGERQRVALARALVGDPAIVLADEPTANLDQDTGAAVVDLMLHYHRACGATFLCATHDPHVMRRAAVVLHLEYGRLAERAA